jgi:hypothetical protein
MELTSTSGYDFSIEVLGMSRMLTVDQMVKENQQAMDRAFKKAMRSKKTARAFLIRAGILNKKGTGLAKPYR